MSKPVHVQIKPKDRESIERTVKRFSRKVKKEGILEDVRSRRYYEKPSAKKRRLEKKRKAVLRRLKSKEQSNY